MVTPIQCAPWVALEGVDVRAAFFVIVSGHRRYEAARRLGWKQVPIRVLIFKDGSTHYETAVTLNGPRENLSPLEEGYAALNMRQAGDLVERVARKMGFTIQTYYRRIALTQLSPELQRKLDPRLPLTKRPIGAMEELGALKAPTDVEIKNLVGDNAKELARVHELSEEARRFWYQRVLYQEVVERRLGAIRAKNYLQDRVKELRTAEEDKNKGKEPRTLREILRKALGGLFGSLVRDWTEGEWKRVSENATPSWFDQQVQMCDDIIMMIVAIRDNLIDARKRFLEQRQRGEDNRPQTSVSDRASEPMRVNSSNGPKRPVASAGPIHPKSAPATVNRIRIESEDSGKPVAKRNVLDRGVVARRLGRRNISNSGGRREGGPTNKPPVQPIPHVPKSPSGPGVSSWEGFTQCTAHIWNSRAGRMVLVVIDTPRQAVEIADRGGFKEGVPQSLDIALCRRLVAQENSDEG